MSNPIGINNKTQYSDVRFIPSQEAMKKSCSLIPPPQSNYQKKLVQALVPNYSEKTLHFSPPKKYEPKMDTPKPPKWEYPLKSNTTFNIKNFYNDYYTNNLDWGKRFLGVNSMNVCYVWDSTKAMLACHIQPKASSSLGLRSVKWSPSGDVIVIGDSHSSVRAMDLNTQKVVFSKLFTSDPTAVCSLSWKTEFELTAAYRGNLVHCDIRTKPIAWRSFASDYKICSLERSPDRSLLVRGGDDNIVEVFDVRRIDEPLFSYSHDNGAVKGLKWVPNSSFFFSGGGFHDHRIKVFDIREGAVVCDEDAESQICSIESLGCDDAIVSMGGSINPKRGIQFWNFDREKLRLKKTAEAFPSEEKFLNVSKNPHSLEFSTISTDEKLRIWAVKPFSNKKHHEREIFSSNPNLNGFTIR